MPRRRSLLPLPGAVIAALLVAATVTACNAAASGNQPDFHLDPATTTDSSASAPTSPPPPPPPETPVAVPAPSPAVPAKAVVAAAEKGRPSGMSLGVAVLDVTTGEFAEGTAGREQFYSASLSKLLLAVDMLDRHHVAGLSQSDIRLVTRALSLSDDGAMNVLWGTYGGPGAMTRVAAGLGLTGTRTPADSSQWGETLVTATDFTRVYQHILREMAPEDSKLIISALAGAQRSAADGFNQYFGLLRHGASAEVYAKQGWVNYRPSKQYLHSAGVLHDPKSGHDYAIALLSIQQSVGKQTAHDRISAVADAALTAARS